MSAINLRKERLCLFTDFNGCDLSSRYITLCSSSVRLYHWHPTADDTYWVYYRQAITTAETPQTLPLYYDETAWALRALVTPRSNSVTIADTPHKCKTSMQCRTDSIVIMKIRYTAFEGGDRDV